MAGGGVCVIRTKQCLEGGWMDGACSRHSHRGGARRNPIRLSHAFASELSFDISKVLKGHKRLA
jgi:hypothetical protein